MRSSQLLQRSASGQSDTRQAAEKLPIFDGGLAVYRDVFIVQYKDSAEYIRIHNMKKPNEVVQKKVLWGGQEYVGKKKRSRLLSLRRKTAEKQSQDEQEYSPRDDNEDKKSNDSGQLQFDGDDAQIKQTPSSTSKGLEEKSK